MKKRLLCVFLTVMLALSMSSAVFADRIPIKPIEDPWDNPENLEPDGGTYFAYSDNGYIVVWETPECNVDGTYMLLNNDTKVTVEKRITYMNNVPWGSVSIELEPDEEGNSQYFNGWVLMTDLHDVHGYAVIVLPSDIPPHPMIADPVVTPAVTDDPASTAEPEPTEELIPTEDPTPETHAPERPAQAITISITYNNAIIYTSVAIAAAAAILVAVLLIKHKALNKKEDEEE